MCDDLWDDNDATVICKQLGYSRGSARVSAFFGEGSGLILLDNVNCNGRESTIFNCRHRNFGENDCTHNEDAGVVCYGESSKGNNNYMIAMLMIIYIDIKYIYIYSLCALADQRSCQGGNLVIIWKYLHVQFMYCNTY